MSKAMVALLSLSLVVVIIDAVISLLSVWMRLSLKIMYPKEQKAFSIFAALVFMATVILCALNFKSEFNVGSPS